MFNFYCVHVGWPIGTMPSKTDEYTDICRQVFQGQSGDRKASSKEEGTVGG